MQRVLAPGESKILHPKPTKWVAVGSHNTENARLADNDVNLDKVSYRAVDISNEMIQIRPRQENKSSNGQHLTTLCTPLYGLITVIQAFQGCLFMYKH